MAAIVRLSQGTNQAEGSEHCRLARRFNAADGLVQSHCGSVVAIRQNPRLCAPYATRLAQQAFHDFSGESLAAMPFDNADLVDPEFGSLFVWMRVTNGAGKPDDCAFYNRDGDVMARISQ